MASSLLAPLLLLAAQGKAADLSAFEANLAARDSATAALQQWCAIRHIADPAVIRATPVKGEDAGRPEGLRQRLGIKGRERIGYRHVRLSCGGTVMSEAHNWFVPGRLTPAMNTLLEQTDTPFGKVVADLHFRREPLAASGKPRRGECPRGTISEHRALLRLPDGRPLAMVVECYTAANLGR